MLTELRGKGGRICQSALDGAIRCPLIVRPTSEDVVTGEIFQALQLIDPRRWLPQLLNRGLGVERFRTQVFRGLKIEVWQKQPAMPRELLPWTEGQTEVDVVITWENPETTVFIEAKYRSDLSATTTHHHGMNGYPSDQLIRNARIGLRQTGWYRETGLFQAPKRNFLLLLLNAAGAPHPLVERYRDAHHLVASLPQNHLIEALPPAPFVGCIGFRDIANVLHSQGRWMSWNERLIANQLSDYLAFKLQQAIDLKI
jgi:hypothetical protein